MGTEKETEREFMKKSQKVLLMMMGAVLLSARVFSIQAFAEEETEVSALSEQAGDRPVYDVRECVDLGRYQNLRIQIPPVQVSEEEVRETADTLIRDSSVMLPAATVQEGDEVNIDYVGTLNGEEFKGGSNEGYMLVIGSGTFVEGFEEGLIGVSVGDTVDLSLTFPENYYLGDLAGRDVIFTVTVHEILREPDLTDEVVAEVTDGAFTETDAWMEELAAGLEEEAQEARQEEIREALVGALAEESVIREYPEDLEEYLEQKERSFYERLAGVYPPVTFDEMIASFGYTGETFDDLLQTRAQEKVERELLLMAVAEEEGIRLSDEEYQDGVKEYMLDFAYRGSTEAFEASYADIYGEEQLGIDLLMDKVLDYMEESAMITEVETENPENENEW